MMSKSLNYAYPQKFAEGGEVQVTDLSGLKQEPLGNDMVLVKFQDGSYGKTQKALFEAAESLGAPMGSQKDFANWHLNEWAPKVVSDPAFEAAHDKFNTDQISYDQAVMDSDPQYAQNRLAFVQTHAPNNAAAISAAEELVATGNYAAENPTYTDQILGYTEEGVEFQGPDMPPSQPKGPGIPATTRMVGEEEGMEGLPPPGMATTMAMGEEEGGLPLPKEPGGELTTMAMGEEDGGGGVIEPDLPRPPNPFLDLEPDTFTTMAMGEEDGGLPIPEKPIGNLTTMAMGEEDGGGPSPLPPPSLDPPMFPPVTPPPNTGYTPPPVVAPEFAPLPVAPGLPQGGSQGRTYGAYSQAGQLGGTTLQPFTPYTPPQQNEGIRSLIDGPVSYLTESGPRSSVFRRS